MTGWRPTRSEMTPSTGMKKNCMSAKTVPKMPSQVAARLALPPRKLRINFGSTGMMMPSATGMRMKSQGGLRGFHEWPNFDTATAYAKHEIRV